jgi:DNA-binding transcriptional LysR family regulator
MSLVRHGLGVGVTNSLAAQVADTSGVCVRRLEGGAGRRVAVHWDSARHLTAAARALLQQIVGQPRPDGTERAPDPGSE